MTRVARFAALCAVALAPRLTVGQGRVGGGSAAAAGDSALDARTREVASQLRCPVCQGLSIQDSPSELSQQMRAVVRQQLAAGRTPDQVKAYFVERYGEWILMAPSVRGVGVLVYLLPALGLAGGAGVLVIAVRRWTTPHPATPHPARRAGPTA